MVLELVPAPMDKEMLAVSPLMLVVWSSLMGKVWMEITVGHSAK